MGPSQFLRINKRSNLKFLVTAFLESIKLGIFVSGNWEELLFSGKLAHSPKIERKKISEKNVEKLDMQTLTFNNTIINFDNVNDDNKYCQKIGIFSVFQAKIQKLKSYEMYRVIFLTAPQISVPKRKPLISQ